MKKWGVRIWSFVKKHRWSILLVGLALAVAGYFLWDIIAATGKVPSFVTDKFSKTKETRVVAPIAGTLVASDIATRKPIAVVIENHPDARPQSGLNKADLVYETFAEGGITRFLAIFQTQEHKEIGPVRSARVYFVEWASSYKALYAHVGGNIDALTMIPKSSLYDLNQFYNGGNFWRDNARYAPHNVYTTITKLYAAASSHKYPTTDSAVPAFVFKKEAKPEERPVAFSFTTGFNETFAVKWTYDPKNNVFLRSMLGVPQKDRIDGSQVAAKNILIGFSDFSYGKTSYNEQVVRIRTTGSGEAVYYIDGIRHTGSWKRSAGNILRFYDTSGSEVKLNPGTTWIEFAPVGTSVK